MKMLQELRLQTQKHRDSTTANMREISKLRRKEKNASDVAKRLERSNQLQRLMLKKRSQEVAQTQQKLRSVMQNIRKGSTPTKVSKHHVSGCTSPIPRVKSRSGRGQLTGSAMNELLASVNSPVRVSVSQSFTTRAEPDIDLRAQFKKQMVDKELYSTVKCRKTQKTLQNHKMVRNRLIEEQKELLAERRRVVEANFKATKIFDEKSPQYMDERVQSIDIEIASIDSSMVELENTLKRHSGILDESGYIGDEGSQAVDLSWENALNLLKSLNRSELDATIAYFLEDVVALRTLEEEYAQELDSKDKVVANLKLQLEEAKESFYRSNLNKGLKPIIEVEYEEADDTTSVSSNKPLLPRIVPRLSVNESDNVFDDSLKVPTSIRIPTLPKRSLMRPMSISPSPNIAEELDNLSFHPNSSARPTSPVKEISVSLSAALPGWRLKDKEDTALEEQLFISADEEPKLKKRYDLLTMGASGDVFQRLAHSHTQASQAKVISRSSIDKDSLMQDVPQESKRKSLTDIEHLRHE
jgi:hypothetical protein